MGNTMVYGQQGSQSFKLDENDGDSTNTKDTTTVEPTSGPDAGCDPSSWIDLDKNVVCGACKGLADNMKTYKTCNAFCAKQGLNCVSAAEEKSDSCDELKQYDCEFDFSSISTSDA